jgi:hypothetical protein
MFWATTAAIGFLLAAAAILSGIQAGLAARLLAAEIMGFEILVWVPKLIATPGEHFVWAGNAISVAMVAAIWVVSDALNEPRRVLANPEPQFLDDAGTAAAKRNRLICHLHARRNRLQDKEGMV